jgi:DNA-binding PadR family transcriptional regulator
MAQPVPDEVILGLLKAQPAHGYELLDCFRSRAQLGRIWRMSTSQLYAVLKRLELEGAIMGQAFEAKNAPTRVVYRVTDHGYCQLKAWLLDPHPSPSVHRIRVLFLSRVYIANLLSISIDQIVTAQVQACQRQCEVFKVQRNTNPSEIEGITLDFVIQQLESAIHWLKNSQFQWPLTSKGAQSD